MIYDHFNIIFWFILGIFTLGAAVLATATWVNVIRLRNIRMSWKTGKLKGYPVFSTIFLLITVVAIVASINQGSVKEIVISGFYLWMGVCWFSTSFFAAKRYVSDHGIVKNVNDPSQTVAWHQIHDFVSRRNDKLYNHYIFIYSTDSYSNPEHLLRLELEVPHDRKESFKKLISHKLGHRIRCYVDEDIDVRQFE